MDAESILCENSPPLVHVKYRPYASLKFVSNKALYKSFSASLLNAKASLASFLGRASYVPKRN